MIIIMVTVVIIIIFICVIIFIVAIMVITGRLTQIKEYSLENNFVQRILLHCYSYNNYTNEIETTISSNFTTIPLVLYSRYFNETDPSTLNRYVGGNFNFAFGEKQFKQTLFYENTYQYWAFGCDIEYMPEQIANLYIMIQYEPQRFLLNFTHAPSNTRILARTIPSLPLLLGELNITHGQDFSVNATGKLDVSSYTAEGSLDIEPSNKHFTGYAEWVPEHKMVKV